MQSDWAKVAFRTFENLEPLACCAMPGTCCWLTRRAPECSEPADLRFADQVPLSYEVPLGPSRSDPRGVEAPAESLARRHGNHTFDRQSFGADTASPRSHQASIIERLLPERIDPSLSGGRLVDDRGPRFVGVYRVVRLTLRGGVAARGPADPNFR